jgi:uncharacterized membrane protein
MLPNPLHPAIVHFPIVLMMLLPVAAGVALWTIRKGVRPARAWLVPLAFATALAFTSWLAVETGEQQEGRVEKVVSEAVIDGHAEAADRFLVLSLVVTALVGLGLVRGKFGATARAVSLVAAAGLVVAGYQVGHSGGQLVYQHGAASAYTGVTKAIEPGDRDDR